MSSSPFPTARVTPLSSPTSSKPRASRERSAGAITAVSSIASSGEIGSGHISTSAPVLGVKDMGVKTPFTMAKYVFELLFCEADADRSGCIDHDEFGVLLRELGVEIAPEVARHCLAR